MRAALVDLLAAPDDAEVAPALSSHALDLLHVTRAAARYIATSRDDMASDDLTALLYGLQAQLDLITQLADRVSDGCFELRRACNRTAPLST